MLALQRAANAHSAKQFTYAASNEIFEIEAFLVAMLHSGFERKKIANLPIFALLTPGSKMRMQSNYFPVFEEKIHGQR